MKKKCRGTPFVQDGPIICLSNGSFPSEIGQLSQRERLTISPQICSEPRTDFSSPMTRELMSRDPQLDRIPNMAFEYSLYQNFCTSNVKICSCRILNMKRRFIIWLQIILPPMSQTKLVGSKMSEDGDYMRCQSNYAPDCGKKIIDENLCRKVNA